MDEYATITIDFSAPSEEIDDPEKEMKLYDEVSRIIRDLEAWLKARTQGTNLTFIVQE